MQFLRRCKIIIMSDFDFIMIYKDMKSIKEICEELKINYPNLMNNNASDENYKKVYDKIVIEILKVYALIQIKEKDNVK